MVIIVVFFVREKEVYSSEILVRLNEAGLASAAGSTWMLEP